MKCELLVGYFLARPCGEAAASVCSKCGKPICVVHTAPSSDPAGPACLMCAAAAGAADWIAPAPDSTRVGRNVSGSNVSGTDVSGTDDLSAFSDEDIAAFDEVSDVDRRRGRGVYDS